MTSPEEVPSLQQDRPQEVTESETGRSDLELVREQFRYQERPAFFDETVLDQDKGDERRKPTDAEREQMNSNMQKLADIFDGSDLRWQLDGALNISLMKGDYIGVHKDVDLTIDQDDLEKLEKQLFSKGYGLFLSSEHEDPKKRKMKWVSAEEFRKAPKEHLMIAAVDERGKIREGESLNFLDVHLVKRDERGRPLGFGGAPLPEKWYEAQPITFKGAEINLSHPAKVAYFKLYCKRGFDETDLWALAETGKLTMDDVGEIENVLEQEFENKRETISTIIERVVRNITETSKPEEIFEALIKDQDVAGRVEKEEDKERLRKLAELIGKQDDKSLENIKNVVMNAVGVEAEISEQRKKLQTLQQRVGDIERIR
jgi:hypothetical protein